MQRLFSRSVLLICYLSSCLLGAAAAIEMPAFAETNATESSATDPGQVEFRLCSQNLNNFGTTKKGKKSVSRKRLDDLIERFREANCDVIALQEVVGKDRQSALSLLDLLARELRAATQRTYLAFTGTTNDERIRNGFLVAQDNCFVNQLKSLSQSNLPRLSSLGPMHHFARGPLILDVTIQPKTAAAPHRFLILNFHFKSKSDNWKDPTRTSFETLRIEMAEAARQALLRELESRSSIDTLVHPVLLGDMNSNSNSATAEVLSGRRVLRDFQTLNGCTVSSALTADCGKLRPQPPLFTGLFEFQRNQLAGYASRGSFKYKGMQYMIDEVFLRPSDLPLVTRPDKSLAIGLTGSFHRGSDHKLLWVELNWPDQPQLATPEMLN